MGYTLGNFKCMTFIGLEIVLPQMSRFSKCESCLYTKCIYFFV